jgi:hypothetical protein
MKDVFQPSFDNKTFQSISMAWGLFTVLLAMFTLFLFVLPDRIEAMFTRRAHFEATLYNLLMQINKKGIPEEVRVTLFEAYLACLRAQYQLDPAEHLRHIPDVETDAVRRVCADLIIKEKLRLSENLKKGLSGTAIQREGLDIERLEAMNTVLNERFKGSITPQTMMDPSLVV